MDQWLKALDGPQEDPRYVPNTQVVRLTSTATPTLGDLTLTPGLYWYLHTKHAHTMHINQNKSYKKAQRY